MNQQKFDSQYEQFVEMSKTDGRFTPKRGEQFPHLSDDGGVQGFDPHYLLHVSWAARKIAESKVIEHHDFGSSLWFAGAVSAFVKFYYHDIRNPNIPFRDIEYSHANLMALPFADGSLVSMSCLHVIEHVGLGRYGDEIDAQGDKKAAKELTRVLMPGGDLLIVAPLNDPPMLRFNADRLYSYDQVIELFPTLALAEFSLITNESGFIPRCSPAETKGRHYSCGCWRFVKL
jgi:SAM-dependent methyltransferase